MKTWEVIKFLTENPKLKAKIKGSDPHGNTLEIFGQGIFFQGDTRPAYLSGHFLSQEWELIREPVPFMEAVKAYAEGKTISVKGPGYHRIYRKIHESQNAIKDQNGLAIGQKEILEGKWYIEE